MNVELPDGTVVEDVPDDISRADLITKLKANGYDTSTLDAPQPTPEAVNPGHAATIRRMDTAATPTRLAKAKQAAKEFGAGEIRHVTGRVLPQVEDVARSTNSPALGTPAGMLLHGSNLLMDKFLPTQGRVTQPISDWGEKTYQQNKSIWADLGEGTANAITSIAMPGPSGKAGMLSNILRNSGASAAQEYALAPQPGETRGGNAARAGIFTGMINSVLGPAGKVVTALRGGDKATADAGSKLVKAAGGREALGEAVDALRPSASGVAMTPAARMSSPGLKELERSARTADPGAFASIDQLTKDTAESIVGKSKDTLWNTLSKVRTNDIHRREAQEIIDRFDFSKTPEVKAEMQAILAQYGKGSGTNLKNMIDHLLQGSKAEIKGKGGATRLTTEEQTKFAKELEKLANRHYKEAAVQAQSAVSGGVARDVAEAGKIRGDATPPGTPIADTIDRVLNSRLTSAGASYKFGPMGTMGVHAARLGSRLLRQARAAGEPNEVLTRAMSDEAAMKVLIQKYDRTLNEQTAAQLAAILTSRAGGAGLETMTHK